MAITPEVYEVIVKIVDERMKEIKVTREDFNELKNTVNELAKAVNGLAEAQKRTEERVNELAEAQKRTEERVNELAEAQKRTEERIDKLVEKIDNLATHVSRLSDTVGYGLEDIAKVVLPSYLFKHFNIKIEDFERRFFIIDNKEIEINLYGEGELNGKKVIILGESKARIYEADVNKFIDDTNKLKFEQEVIRLIFGYLIHPSAQSVATSNNIILVASYQR